MKFLQFKFQYIYSKLVKYVFKKNEKLTFYARQKMEHLNLIAHSR